MIERRSASGVRISGDDYQHLVAWTQAVPALYVRTPWVALELEAVAPNSLDDIVIEMASGARRFIQVKYAADAQRQLGAQLLTEVEGRATRSLLQKLYDGWRKLGQQGDVATIELVTNRSIDPDDPLLSLLDARDESFRRIVSGPPSRGPIAVALQELASHLDVERVELLTFLEVVRVRAAKGVAHLKEIAAAHMTAAGLVSTDHAVRQGIDAMRQLVTDDVGPITPSMLSERTSHMERAGEGNDALVVVEAIDRDPAADTASHRIDWRDQYPQETVDQRVVPSGGEEAYRNFWVDLRDLHASLDDVRAKRPLVRGTVRLASWFALGYALRAVDGFHLSVQRGPYMTRCDTRPSGLELIPELVDLDRGGSGDVALALGVSADPSSEVRAYLETEERSVAVLLRLIVPPRPSPSALQSDADVAAVVACAREAVRPYVGRGRAHLFMACPAGVAAMLGHTWHRLPPVSVYEHVAPGYMRAYEFD